MFKKIVQKVKKQGREGLIARTKFGLLEKNCHLILR